MSDDDTHDDLETLLLISTSKGFNFPSEKKKSNTISGVTVADIVPHNPPRP
jgi:hypothetical protein